MIHRKTKKVRSHGERNPQNDVEIFKDGEEKGPVNDGTSGHLQDVVTVFNVATVETSRPCTKTEQLRGRLLVGHGGRKKSKRKTEDDIHKRN